MRAVLHCLADKQQRQGLSNPDTGNWSDLDLEGLKKKKEKKKHNCLTLKVPLVH